MTAPRFSKWFSKCLAAGLLMVSAPTELRADEYYDTMDTSIYVDNTDHDLQFFSPVDFDFEKDDVGAEVAEVRERVVHVGPAGRRPDPSGLAVEVGQSRHRQHVRVPGWRVVGDVARAVAGRDRVPIRPQEVT
jgi:hypothetical protein